MYYARILRVWSLLIDPTTGKGSRSLVSQLIRTSTRGLGAALPQSLADADRPTETGKEGGCAMCGAGLLMIPHVHINTQYVYTHIVCIHTHICTYVHASLQTLSNEIGPFMCSGSHVIQGDCHPSALETFLEGVAQCNPPIHLRSNVLKYLSKTHNSWHQGVLLLEERAIVGGDLDHQQKIPPSYSSDVSSDEAVKSETLDALSDLYCGLKEDDMWTGLWVTRCRYVHRSCAVH